MQQECTFQVRIADQLLLRPLQKRPPLAQDGGKPRVGRVLGNILGLPVEDRSDAVGSALGRSPVVGRPRLVLPLGEQLVARKQHHQHGNRADGWKCDAAPIRYPGRTSVTTLLGSL